MAGIDKNTDLSVLFILVCFRFNWSIENSELII